MVDFKKKLGKSQIDRKVNPIEIYSSLDRRTMTGPLRPAQSKILTEWFSNLQDDKDIIIKLHTGEGKTLIGLLILLSKINQNQGLSLYICPNKYLVQQVALEAQKFGVPFCLLEPDNQLPNEFLDGRKILITHVQMLFNGRSKFGLDNNYLDVSNIILDDSHACIDSIKSAFTIRIRRDNELFDKLLSIFEDDLIEQGEGSFLDIKANISNTLITVPYWAWIDKKSEVLSELSAKSDDIELTFVWPLIKNQLENCQAHITSNGIEIVPLFIPINSFSSFSKARQRILMSATTQDDAFFIKGLGFSLKSITNPLVNNDQIWSGEKMILIPSLIDDSLDKNLVVPYFSKPAERKFGTVALVPSYRSAEQYEHRGAEISSTNNIFENILKLKNGEISKTLVIVNRYDGIDLPDESCRILLIDSLPFFETLIDRYEEQCRVNSDVINIKLAQRIEQGLGRSVRGEKDYSVIILVGESLVKFVKSVRTNKYFSAQTRKQIEIGLEVAELAKEELKADESALKVLISLILQSIKRDDGWKEYYKEEMNKISINQINNSLYNILQLEGEAEAASQAGDYESASSKIQILLDSYVTDDSEKGWYLQILARYQYFISKTTSNKLQKRAFLLNHQMLKPKDGVNYKKIEIINESRINRIKNWISAFDTYGDFFLAVDSILSDFSFGVDSEKFEIATKEIGTILGFVSQRPDKEYRKGPDNLWGGVDNKYFLIECKSEVVDTRVEINKYEAGQMNSHCGWFESEYGDSYVKRILIIPTKKLSYYGDFTHNVEIMKKGKLNLLKKNIKAFIKEFRLYKIGEISDEAIQNFINTHKLDLKSLESEYTEKWTKS